MNHLTTLGGFVQNMKGLLLFCIFCDFLNFNTVKAATPSVSGCPPYVAEDGILSCTCTDGGCKPPYSLNWPGHSPTSNILVVQQVKKQDDGKQYTCQLTCESQISTVTYTLKVAYGPDSNNMSITGELPFITNGTQVLNLTCLAAVATAPAPVYFWRGSLCGNGSDGNTCSFTPLPEDDGKIVTCWAYNPVIPSKQISVNVTVNITYPPDTAPKISPNWTNTVKAEDTLSCTVTGGNPPVVSINFSCDIPHHPGQNNTKINDSVTSYITVDTSQATDDNMTCSCSAYWAPKQSYYTKSAKASFRTEYPAKTKAFTVNGQNSTVTANIRTNVTLLCEARGLPSPNITLHGPQGDDLIGNLTHANDTHSKMERTIVAVTDTHMGNYTCIASNNLGKVADNSTFTLNVNFPPRFNSSDGTGHSPNTAVNMSEQGIDIELRAYPIPDSFGFAGYYNNSNDACNMSLVSAMFNATVSQRSLGSPYATCHIRPEHNVQKGCLYTVNISNGFGSVPYYFNVTGVPPPPKVTTTRTTTLSDSNIADNTGLIVGVVVGTAAALIIIIIVFCCCCKRKGKDSSTQGRSNPTFSKDDVDNNSAIDENMSASKMDSKPAQHQHETGHVDGCEVRDGVMRKKSARGQAYEVTSLVKGGGARIAGETTKPPAKNSNGGYAEPWRDFNQDMPDGQPGVNKSLAHTTATRAGSNASPDHYAGPGGDEYASFGEHGKGGNKKAAILKQTDKTGTAAKPATGNTGNSAVRTSGDHYAKMDDCSGQTPGSHSYTKVDSNQKSKPPYINVLADRPLEMDPSGPAFNSPGYSTVAQASRDKGNKTSGMEKHSGAESTDARGSDTYDHFSRQGQQSRPYDPTYAHTHDL